MTGRSPPPRARRIFGTLISPTIPFSGQYRIRIDWRFQPHNSTPTSGTRLTTTRDTTATGDDDARYSDKRRSTRPLYPAGQGARAAPVAGSGAGRTLEPMDDQRWEPGMPVLDRQAVGDRRPPTTLPPSLAALPPRSVPESAPTPLQRHYVNLSVVALIAGAIAITALELGTPLRSPLVRLCILVGAPILVVTTADA